MVMKMIHGLDLPLDFFSFEKIQTNQRKKQQTNKQNQQTNKQLRKDKRQKTDE